MSHETTPDQIPPGFKLRHMLRGHQGIILRIAWSPDGRTLASSSSDGTIRLWNGDTGKPSFTFKGHSGPAISLAWSPSGHKLASGGKDDTIRLWSRGAHHLRNVETQQARLSPGENPGAPGIGNTSILSLIWSPDGRTLAAGDNRRYIRLWNTETWQTIKTLKRHYNSVICLAWSPDGRALASGDWSGTINLWNKAWRRRYTLPGLSNKVSSLAWMPDGRTLISGNDDGTIRLWDAATGHLKNVLEGHTGHIKSIAVSFDGHLLASKSTDGTIRLWRCDTGESVAVLEEPTSGALLTNLAFHPKAPVLATLGEEDTIVRIWDLNFNDIIQSPLKHKSVFYTTAKITLVGDSGTGKTGLGWRLAHGKFKEHPSTHGQQFWVIDEWGETRKDGTQCEAVLWDLAGQPDYRLVHALFLDDVDVALVLFDPANRQEPLRGVEYWLKQLARARRDGRGRRVILVGARADRGVPTLTREELEEFCRSHGVEAYVGTSALTGEGLGELLERVRASIVWEEMPATVTTKTFKRVKEFVLGLKEEGASKGVLVSPAELRVRLEATDAEWEFTDDEMMTAVRHLSNHGYVSVLRGSSGEETILLAPDLLANLAASFVLEARRNPRGLGALDESRVLAGGYEFPEFAGLEERERDVLLDAAVALFIEHNLCFRETLGAQTFLIFPALINQKRPQLAEAETEDDFSYRVTGAVENVYAALVVQLGYTNTFTRTNQWQNQAEYETARGDVCGFRQEDEREGEIELVLYHAKEHAGARLLFQGLFEEFLRGRDVTVLKFPPVGCPACGYRQQRGEVVRRITEGRGFLFCGECGGRIVLPREGEKVILSRAEREQLGEEQERTRRRTEFESALVRVKAVVRDEKKASPSCFISYAWGDEGRERWVRGLARDLENAGVSVVLDRKDNAQLGASVARFVSRIEESDFVAVVGTPLYRRKYENMVSSAGSVVASEVDLIHLRLTGTEEEKATVLPLLVEGTDRTSLPPLMRGRVYGDFLDEKLYFASLFDLILTLYRIRFGHPAVSDLRDALRAGAERWR